MNKKVIVSWSGGKDCCFALYKALQLGFEPVSLVTTMPVGDQLTYGHGFSKQLLFKQAERLNIPINIAEVETDYRSFYIDLLLKYKSYSDIEGVVFGDLYLMAHRTWLEDVCMEAGLTSHFLLWMKPEEAYTYLLEFIDLGFKSMIVKTRKSFLGKEWIGQSIDNTFADYAQGKFCPMGESGEFHTLVMDGPIFQKPLKVELTGISESDKEYQAELACL